MEETNRSILTIAANFIHRYSDKGGGISFSSNLAEHTLPTLYAFSYTQEQMVVLSLQVC